MHTKRLKQVAQKARLAWLNACLALFALQQGALAAGLPTVEEPSRGKGAGIFETAKNYAYDASVLVGLLIAVMAFSVVAWHSVSVFADVQRGKKTWADFGGVFVVGIILVVLCIWLVSKAAEIL